MATYNLTKKTNASTGSRAVPSNQEIRVQNLEDKVTSQGDKFWEYNLKNIHHSHLYRHVHNINRKYCLFIILQL